MREFHEAGDLQGKALAVGDVPVELVDLFGIFVRSIKLIEVEGRTLDQLIASKVRLMSETGKLSRRLLNEKVRKRRRITHKFRAVSSMNPLKGYEEKLVS